MQEQGLTELFGFLAIVLSKLGTVDGHDAHAHAGRAAVRVPVRAHYGVAVRHLVDVRVLDDVRVRWYWLAETLVMMWVVVVVVRLRVVGFVVTAMLVASPSSAAVRAEDCG